MICSNCKANCSDDSLYCAKCGQSLIGSDMQITRNDFTHELKNNRSLNFKSGEKFGERYEIIKELGKGGMGQVFKAHDNVLGIDVALKMIRPEFLMNKKMISRFKQEILLAREITHENVSRIHDFGDVDGIKFISMEFISGRTLKDIVRQDGPVEIERAIEISKAICGGLSAAHKKEIVHRDLKPQNIMIDDDGHVFITDFGLAKSVREENVSHTGLVIGTPQYIPPELWKGEVADQRSDIYSLGIIMYEMVAGEELFQSDSDYGYLQKHVNEEPKFPPPVKDKLPSFFRQLILRCLAKEREARYQDCSQIYRDLKDRMFSKGTFISEVERSIKRTGPRKIALGILFILIISFIGSLILEKGPPKQKKRSVAILYFKNLSGLKSLDHFSYSLPELLTTDLGQSKYIKVLPEDKVSKVLKESNYLSSAFIDEKMFEELGDQANVNYLVQGSFIKSGNDLRITVKLRDSDTGEMLSTDYQDATMDNIFPAVDRLTTGLKRRFNLTDKEIMADIDNNIEDITTSSAEALAFYITGKKLFYENKYKESISEFQKAVAIDPEFAMAYRGIAYSYSYMSDMKNRDEYFNKTFQHITKMSEKEKLLIYGDYYGENFSTFDKSLENYNKLLEIYPDDINANLETGFFYMWFEEWDRAIQRLRIVLENERGDIFAVRLLVQSYLGKGDLYKAEKLILTFEKTFGNKNRFEILKLKYRLYMISKRYEKAIESVNQQKIEGLLKDYSHAYLIAKINLLQYGSVNSLESYQELLALMDGEFDYTETNDFEYMFLFNGLFGKYVDFIDKKISTLKYPGYIKDSLCRRFYLELRSGNKNAARSILQQYETNKILNSQKAGMVYIDHFLKGLANIVLEKFDTAEIHIKHIEDTIENTLFIKDVSRLCFLLKGLLEKNRKDPARALQYFEEANKYTSKEWGQSFDINAINSYIYYELGENYYSLKKYDQSEKWFRALGDLTLSRYFYGDLYTKSLYFLGNIYFHLKEQKKAEKMYAKFISAWEKSGNTGVKDLISEAKKKLKSLRN